MRFKPKLDNHLLRKLSKPSDQGQDSMSGFPTSLLRKPVHHDPPHKAPHVTPHTRVSAPVAAEPGLGRCAHKQVTCDQKSGVLQSTCAKKGLATNRTPQ